MGIHRWSLLESQLVDLTPEKARDLVVECFFQAQHETFARAKKALGARGLDEASLRADVVTAIRLVFEEVGGEYDRPAPESLVAVVQALMRKAEAWGTPPEIVEHHARQLRRMLQLVGASLP